VQVVVQTIKAHDIDGDGMLSLAEFQTLIGESDLTARLSLSL
jgi:hypothetical protein